MKMKQIRFKLIFFENIKNQTAIYRPIFANTSGNGTPIIVLSAALKL